MGALMGAKLSAELDRGTSIDIATLMVGKLRTTVARARRAELAGTCSEATHFIRGASIGAFAMKQGTRGKIETSAEVFGGSGGASSESTKSTTSKAGVLDACKQADRGDTEPPKQCGASLRVELDAIESAQPTAAAAHQGADREYVCPQGLVYSSGKCARADGVTAYVCRKGDAEQCSTQCNRGNAASCVTLGTMYGEGRGVSVDQSRAGALWQKGCELGNHDGCVGWAVRMYRGSGVTKDVDHSFTLMSRECDAGSFYGCEQLGLAYTLENRNLAQALSLEMRACNGGAAGGCLAVAQAYAHGNGVPMDLARSKEYGERSCQEGKGVGIGCGNLGMLYASGNSVVPKDDAKAFHYLELGCNMPLGMGTCEEAANFSEQGRGTTPDAARARRFLLHGCEEGDARACGRMATVFAHKNPPELGRARDLYRKACDLRDEKSCAALKTLPSP
jgi:TPR repeat protein